MKKFQNLIKGPADEQKKDSNIKIKEIVKNNYIHKNF